MRARTLTLVIAGMALASQVPRLEGETAQLAFDSLFNLGAILEDRNGDGIVDFVNVRIVVPESASPLDISGAAVLVRSGWLERCSDRARCG